jgi:hypothetical protein
VLRELAGDIVGGFLLLGAGEAADASSSMGWNALQFDFFFRSCCIDAEYCGSGSKNEGRIGIVVVSNIDGRTFLRSR